MNWLYYKGKKEKKDWFDCSKKKKFNIEDLVKAEDEKFGDVDIVDSVFKNWGKMEIDDYAVSIQELTTVLGGQKVLDNLSFNIPPPA